MVNIFNTRFIFNSKYGIYCADNFAVVDNITVRSGRENLNKARKNLFWCYNFFKNFVWYKLLNATFYLWKDSYKPHKKPNNHSLYISIKSKNQAQLFKSIPVKINNTLRRYK